MRSLLGSACSLRFDNQSGVVIDPIAPCPTFAVRALFNMAVGNGFLNVRISVLRQSMVRRKSRRMVRRLRLIVPGGQLTRFQINAVPEQDGLVKK
jgi:hypothetical protein